MTTTLRVGSRPAPDPSEEGYQSRLRARLKTAKSPGL
jgi:hypothetical protein